MSTDRSPRTSEPNRTAGAGARGSRLAAAREKLTTTKAVLVSASLVAFCGALLFARAESPNAGAATGGSGTAASNAQTAPATDAGVSASDAGGGYDGGYDSTYGNGFSQGSLSGGSGLPQGRTGMS